jgi:hypothetical protein
MFKAYNRVTCLLVPMPFLLVTVCVMINAFVLPGCDSGKHIYSRAFGASVRANTVTNIPKSTVPWVGSDVALYRVETYLTGRGEEQPTLPCSQYTTNTLGFEQSSLAEYWLSDWTNTSQPQNMSALGTWRDDTSRHVELNANAGWCDCPSSELLCQRAGCSSSEIVLQISNPPRRIEKGNSGCGVDAIAFAVWTELHYDTREKSGIDTRVLPTLYSDGLFSVPKTWIMRCLICTFESPAGTSEEPPCKFRRDDVSRLMLVHCFYSAM